MKRISKAIPGKGIIASKVVRGKNYIRSSTDSILLTDDILTCIYENTEGGNALKEALRTVEFEYDNVPIDKNTLVDATVGHLAEELSYEGLDPEEIDFGYVTDDVRKGVDVAFAKFAD